MRWAAGRCYFRSRARSSRSWPAVLNLVLRDTLLTGAEYASMAAGRADSAGPATGSIVFTDWVHDHGGELGRRYANELDRHFRQASATM